MARRIPRTRKSFVIMSAIALTIAGAGAAFAYWTSSGSGTGTATTGTSSLFTIESADPVGDPLVPGGPGQTVAFTVTNPLGAGKQYLGSVTVVVANADGSEWTSGGACSEADFTAVITTPPFYGQYAPGDAVGGSATVAMTNTNQNQDACKNISVPLYFAASSVDLT